MNPYEAVPSPDAIEAGAGANALASTVVRERASWLESSWRGAKVGLRCTLYVFGPIAYLMIVLSTTLTAFGMGSGRGFALHQTFLNGFGIFFGSALYGVLLGSVFGLIGSAIPWRRIGSPFSGLRRLLRLRPKPEKQIAPLRPRRRRWLWIGLWLASGFALLLQATAFGTGVYFGGIVDRKLTAAVAAADRDDPDWRLDDLMATREPVPDEENSAPVVAEVVSLLPEGWPPDQVTAQGQPRLPPSEASKAFERLNATEENVRLDEETADVLRRALGDRPEAVQRARTVANYDRGRHELVIAPNPIDTPLAETQEARIPARLLSTDASIRAHDGDLDGALDSCRAALAVGRSIGDEPYNISQLVHIAMGVVAMKATERTLGQGEPSDEALDRLQALVLKDLHEPILINGLRGELAMHVELIRRLGDGELPMTALSGGKQKVGPSMSEGVIAPWGQLWFDNQLAVAIEWRNELMAIANGPNATRPKPWKAWDDKLDRVRHSRTGPFTSTHPLLLMAGISAFPAASARYQAKLGTMVILLAAERHRRKTGEWPASIAKIDPAILSDPPLDPYTGEPFRMERVEGQIIIHSVGRNLKDERGAYDVKRWRDQVLDDVGARAWDVSQRGQPPAQRP